MHAYTLTQREHVLMYMCASFISSCPHWEDDLEEIDHQL